MSLLLQQIIIGVVLAGAVGYLVWHFVRRSRKKRPCAACSLMKLAEKKQASDRNHAVSR